MLPRLISVVLCSLLALTLVPGCGGGKDKDGNSGSSSSKNGQPGISGNWKLDVAAFNRAAFDAGVASGDIPAGTDFNDPQVQAMFGQRQIDMTLSIKGDGTISVSISGMDDQDGQRPGTWTKEGEDYRFTWTKKNGEEESGLGSLSGGTLRIRPESEQGPVPAFVFNRS